ncbi:hypothetical protein ATM97_09945 [Nocardia sp. MH4]|nr:hypothetical protein [Nocardia sp. MH4]
MASDLLPRRSSGGARLPEPVKEIIHKVLRARYLTRQKRFDQQKRSGDRDLPRDHPGMPDRWTKAAVVVGGHEPNPAAGPSQATAARQGTYAGKKKGQHPSPATVLRLLRDHDVAATAASSPPGT